MIFNPAECSSPEELLKKAKEVVSDKTPWKSTFPHQRVYSLRNFKDAADTLDAMFETTASRLPHIHIHESSEEIAFIGTSEFNVQAAFMKDSIRQKDALPLESRSFEKSYSSIVIRQGETIWSPYFNEVITSKIFSMAKALSMHSMKLYRKLMHFSPEPIVVAVSQYDLGVKTEGILTIASNDQEYFDVMKHSFIFNFFTSERFVLDEVTGCPAYTDFGMWETMHGLYDPVMKTVIHDD